MGEFCQLLSTVHQKGTLGRPGIQPTFLPEALCPGTVVPGSLGVTIYNQDVGTRSAMATACLWGQAT